MAKKKRSRTLFMVLGVIGLMTSSAMTAQAFDTVSGPSSDPDCMVPWSPSTQFLRYPEKPGPYRIALSNGYAANDWRKQMLKTAKAYVAQPDVAAQIGEFKAVSTGEDVEAQIAAINAFIDAGYDAIVVDAENPTAFAPVIARAKQAGIVLVAFDNTLDTQDAINVDVDQKGIGKLTAEWLIRNLPDGGTLLEVRGVEGTSVDSDRHEGVRETLAASSKTWKVIETTGKWNDAVAKQATTTAIAAHGPFDGIISQAGDSGVIAALMEAKHPFVPMAGETENGFRKLCATYAKDGLKCMSAGTGPAQVAVAIKVALAALQGKTVPQAIKLPTTAVQHPDFKAGRDFYPDQPDGFFVGNAFPSCGIDISVKEIMQQPDESP